MSTYPPRNFSHRSLLCWLSKKTMGLWICDHEVGVRAVSVVWKETKPWLLTWVHEERSVLTWLSLYLKNKCFPLSLLCFRSHQPCQTQIWASPSYRASSLPTPTPERPQTTLSLRQCALRMTLSLSILRRTSLSFTHRWIGKVSASSSTQRLTCPCSSCTVRWHRALRDCTSIMDYRRYVASFSCFMFKWFYPTSQQGWYAVVPPELYSINWVCLRGTQCCSKAPLLWPSSNKFAPRARQETWVKVRFAKYQAAEQNKHPP